MAAPENSANKEHDIAMGKGKGWNICCLRLEPADNGFIVKCELERKGKTKRGSDGPVTSSYDETHDTKTFVAESLENAMAKMKSLIEEYGMDMNKGGDEENDD